MFWKKKITKISLKEKKCHRYQDAIFHQQKVIIINKYLKERLKNDNLFKTIFPSIEVSKSPNVNNPIYDKILDRSLKRNNNFRLNDHIYSPPINVKKKVKIFKY